MPPAWMSRSSALKSTLHTVSSAGQRSSSAPDATSKSRTSPSRVPAASRSPELEKRRSRTVSFWPRSTARIRPVAVSSSRTSYGATWSVLLSASKEPSGLRSKLKYDVTPGRVQSRSPDATSYAAAGSEV